MYIHMFNIHIYIYIYICYTTTTTTTTTNNNDNKNNTVPAPSSGAKGARCRCLQNKRPVREGRIVPLSSPPCPRSSELNRNIRCSVLDIVSTRGS